MARKRNGLTPIGEVFVGKTPPPDSSRFRED